MLREAREIACTGTVGYGISFDLDAIDPREAPGVGSPVRAGLGAAEAINALAQHACDPALRGLEIVEYNPYLDHDAQTIALVPAIAEASSRRNAPSRIRRLDYCWRHPYARELPWPSISQGGEIVVGISHCITWRAVADFEINRIMRRCD